MEDEKTIGTAGDVRKMLLGISSNEELAKASMSAAYAVEGVYGQGYEISDPKTQEEWIALYSTYVWAYAGIYAIASTIAQLDYKDQKRPAGGEWEDVGGHGSISLLKKPNDAMSGYDLMEATIVYLETCGVGYFETVYGQQELSVGGEAKAYSTKTPSELWPIRPSYLKPVLRKDGKGIEKWEFVTSGVRQGDFTPEQIVPFRYLNPLNEWDGQGSLQAAVRELRLDAQMAAWNLDFFEHGIVPEGIFTTDSRTLTKPEMEQLGEQIRNFLEGKGRTILILSKGLHWEQVSINAKDVDYLQGRSQNREAVLAALGVPPIKVGLLEHAKYDNYALQLEAFYRDTIVPKCKKVESALNSFYLPKWPDIAAEEEAGTDWRIEFDKTEIMKEDEELLSKRLDRLFRIGMVTPNEGRARLGQESWPKEQKGGDDFYIDTRVQSIEMMGSTQSLEEVEDAVAKRLAAMEDDFDRSNDAMFDRTVAEVVQQIRDAKDD